MRIIVSADDGDQITLNVDELATEQRLLHLEFRNVIFDEEAELTIAMPMERARELASAILSVADALTDDCTRNPSSFSRLYEQKIEAD